MNIYYKKGFTFIELIVIISVIALLSSIIFSGVSAARKNGRVGQRIADLKQVQNALELYYANNKAYPVSVGSTHASMCPAWGGLNSDAVIPGLSPTYIKTLPSDPQMKAGSNSNCYIYISNGVDYAFIAYDILELYDGSPGATISKYPELYDPVRTTYSWKVYSPGAWGW